MANYRIPYLVGNKLGRDHQFWPAVDLEFLDADYVGSVNLATLMQIAWRVREWTVSAGTMHYEWTAGATHYVFDGSWAEFTMEMRRALNPDFPVGDYYKTGASEGEILGPVSSSPILVTNVHGHVVDKWNTLRNLGIKGPDDDPADNNGPWDAVPSLGSFQGGVSAVFMGGELTFDPVRKVFALPFGIGGAASVAGLHPSIFFQAASPNDLAASPGRDAGGTVTITDPAGGADIIVPIAIEGIDVFDLGGSGTVSDITVIPTKWWKYRNSLGQDVYDEFSGVQINDPFA